ncbi:MAG: hypothetical protein EOP52_03990 [Sphingobacteriales bacterium]|nr:MAG: hypothetical protein EOP52_03990 [Sphingobacteriales bacterium]
MILKPNLIVFLVVLTSLCACSLSRKGTFNRLSDEEACRLENTQYPMVRATYRIRKGLPKDKTAAQYLDQVSFINIYDPKGQLVASTGTGTCEFKTLSTFKTNTLKPDSTRTLKSLLTLLDLACSQTYPDTNRKNTIVIGSGQFLDQIPTYRSRRKQLVEQLQQFPEATTDVWIVNFDLRPDTVSGKGIR